MPIQQRHYALIMYLTLLYARDILPRHHSNTTCAVEYTVNAWVSDNKTIIFKCSHYQMYISTNIHMHQCTPSKGYRCKWYWSVHVYCKLSFGKNVWTDYRACNARLILKEAHSCVCEKIIAKVVVPGEKVWKQCIEVFGQQWQWYVHAPSEVWQLIHHILHASNHMLVPPCKIYHTFSGLVHRSAT